MKNLFKLTVLVAGLSVASESSAQTVGLKAGLNLSEMYVSDTYGMDYKIKPGLNAGVTAEFPVTEMFSFESGMVLSTKGMKGREDLRSDDKYEGKINLLYLDAPLTAKVSVEMGGVGIYGAAGPYIGMGLSGKVKNEYILNGETDKEEIKIKWGSDKQEDDLKRLDYGIIAGAGAEVNAVQIGLSYGLGLANIHPDPGKENKLSHRVFSLSVGYKFSN